MSCNEYFLVTLESKSTPVRHKYTNLTDEWYGPDGVKYEDPDTITKIEEQATDKNRIGDNTLYQKLIEIHSQGESIKSGIGDIGQVLDYINGEEVMGTISDKLMRIINTKEDIRQALISKGHHIPTSIPFKEYAKMILDLPCKVDDFPKLPGDVTRWHFGGLTNEMMAAMDDPRIEDADGKGRFLSFKNFAWKEGSGISDVYPGFILGDGVDDFAVTEKELNFEDTYTVYTAFIPLQNDPIKNMIVCGKDYKKDFYINYGTQLVFYTANSTKSIPLHINQFTVLLCKRDKTTGVIKNLVTGESFQFSVSQLISNPGLYYLWRSATVFSYGKTAIAGQTICNGYFSTDEDDEKVLDWYKKQYPWLFPDQAWTVTGKTNEDEDRATIANITGNGNDLVLSNFGFAEGSGYGLYGFKFLSKAGIEYYSGSKISFSKHQLDQITLIPYILVYPGTSYPREKDIPAKIKVAGFKEGVSLTWGWAGRTELTITEDGTYSISAGSGKLRELDVVYAEGFDPDHVVTIEQIPEYEGYLVTDGVDDKIVSAKSIAFTDTWTIITDAIFLGEKVVSAGILVEDIFGVSNLMEYGRVEVSVKGGVLLKVPTPSIKAICSDGRIYDADWNEYQAEPGTIKVSEGKLYIGMWYNGMQFCSIAFKNIATYNGYALSKDDCIKAYNYLQTLKAK